MVVEKVRGKETDAACPKKKKRNLKRADAQRHRVGVVRLWTGAAAYRFVVQPTRKGVRENPC